MAINSSAVRRRRPKALRIGEVPAGERSLGDVILYESDGAGVRLEVRLERETVWLTQAQMAELFQRDQSVVSRHMRNVPRAAPRFLYSLDVVVSVGYRVKSPQGTQFRIWATRTLRDHLIRSSDACALVNHLRRSLSDRGETTDLFGREREHQLGAILGAIKQTFGGVALYRSVQARAAHLLYFVIKDHPFVDGNKRIGTQLFLEYLRRNGLLKLPSGTLRFADNAMVAIALLVAASDPVQKELMVRLILNLLGSGDSTTSH